MSDTQNHQAEPIEFDPILTMDQIQNAEDNRGPTRRAALAALTRSSKELRDGLTDDSTAEALLWLVDCINDYIKSTDTELELMKTAQARILSVLSDKYPGPTNA